MNLPPSEGERLFRAMLLVRKAEERLARDFKAGALPGPVHLYLGQEAVAVGICAQLSDRDWITSTHRGHGHFLAKGGDVAALFAEVYGRATGVCGGMGGSMHVADFGKGILGANGIVGGGIALAAGAALTIQRTGSGGVAVAFFGDGASSEGVLSETMNIAALWNLPLIFVCENNGYSEFSATDAVTAGRIFERARPFGIPTLELDGNDLTEVSAGAVAAIARARRGEGPTFIEANTYRFHGHVEGEAGFLRDKYRTDQEILERRQRDPISRFRERLVETGIASAQQLESWEQDVEQRVNSAADQAAEDPWPDLDQLETVRIV